jgi:hypothetical protein
MNIKNIPAFIVLIALCSALQATASNSESKVKAKGRNDRIVCISIPKCGTHLLLKTLALLNKRGFEAEYKKDLAPSTEEKALFKEINTQKPPNHYKGRPYPLTDNPLINKAPIYPAHWPYQQETAEYLNRRTQANFLIIRDPRAMLASMAFMLKDGWNEGEHANPHDLMWDFIDGRQKNFIQWGVEINELYPLLWEKGVVEFYKLYLPWMKAKKFLLVRFEDLVGSKGGGSNEVQLKTIHAIAKHVSVKLTPEKIAHIKNNLFGDTATFREGSIDGWKKHFTPEMKQAFKKVPGANQLLIELGYEKNTNW